VSLFDPYRWLTILPYHIASRHLHLPFPQLFFLKDTMLYHQTNSENCRSHFLPYNVLICNWTCKGNRVSEWLLFNTNSAIFQLYLTWREQVSFQWDDDEVRFVLDQHAELDFYSAHWNNSPWVVMLLHSDKLFWFRAKQTLLFLLNAACFNGEATNTNFIVLGWTRSGLEHTTYHTGGEHANHYATDVVAGEIERKSLTIHLIFH
jgi:hypothetical protein